MIRLNSSFLILFVFVYFCCLVSGLAVKSQSQGQSQGQSQVGNENGELCKFLIGFIQEIENPEPGQIKTELSEVCNFVSDELASVCFDIVSHDDFSIVQDVLEKKLPASVICKSYLKEHISPQSLSPIKSKPKPNQNTAAAPNGKEKEQQQQQQPLKAQPKQHIKSKKTGNASAVATVTSNPKNIINFGNIATHRLECNLCNFLVSQIEGFIEKNKSMAEIIDALEQSCNILGDMTADCKELVAEYMPEAIKRIINKESPDVVCTNVGICKPTTSTGDSATTGGSVGADVSPLYQPRNGFECPSCQYLAREVVSYIKANQSESVMIVELNSDCEVFRDQTWINICQSIVESKGAQLISDVRSTNNPTEACEMVGICGGSSTGSGSSGTSGTHTSSGHLTGSTGDSGTGFAYRMTIS